jgi:hypothetical protein
VSADNPSVVAAIQEQVAQTVPAIAAGGVEEDPEYSRVSE